MSYGERSLEAVDLGRMRYGEALRIQETLVEERKRGEGGDTLLFVEHPHVIRTGRNGKEHNLLASSEVLERTGIEIFETNRGGDVADHGPGALVGCPICDSRGWMSDVH